MEAMEQNGSVRFKNGGNRWSKPVIFTDDDRIFARGQDLATELGVPAPTVSDAVAKGKGPLAGHVRFATLVEVRERLMSQVPGQLTVKKGRVYLHDHGFHLLAHYQDRVYTIKELAKKLSIPTSTASSRALRGSKGVRVATIDEATRRFAPRVEPVKAAPEEIVGVPSVFEDPETVTEVAPAPFIGIIWPDGQVTVRLAAGGNWSLTRESVDSLPPEIKVDCAWLG
jgi:hypothetical protein